MSSFAEIYARFEVIDPTAIFVWPSADHSMAGSLDRYVTNRLPATTLRALGAQIEKVLVLGIYPTHLAALATELGLGPLTRLPFQAKPPRQLNQVRPWFFLAHGGHELVVVVPPGLDYLKHYTSLLRQFYGDRANPVIEARHYPAAAAAMAHWSGLDRLVFEPGATVLVGHIDAFEQVVANHRGHLERLGGNAYLSRARFVTPVGRPVHVLGFAFSFWGDIAGRLAAQAYAAGADELIYLGKVGALDRDLELYRALLVPDSFMLATHDQILRPPFRVPNGLAAVVGGSGLHVTAPTILEQSYLQRRAFEALAPRSIDNEIGYMALAAAAHNLASRETVRFSSLSFATDYVRRSIEASLPATFDLSNNRSTPARALRDDALARAADLLYRYLAGENLDAVLAPRRAGGDLIDAPLGPTKS